MNKINGIEITTYSTLISNVISERLLTEAEKNIIDNNSTILINICNEHRCLPLFYQAYDKYEQKNKEFHKALKTRFIESLICHKQVESAALNVLEKLNQANINYIVLKGFALSIYLYETSYLRPFVDIDLLVKDEDIQKLKTILLSEGFCNPRGWQPKYIISQFTMYKPLSKKLFCYFDIHQKISNDKKLSKLISFQEAYAISEHVIVNNINMSLISQNYAFIHACFHLLKHQYQGDTIRLAWLYDLVLLISKLTEIEKHQLIVEINDKKINNVVIKALFITKQNFKNSKIDSFYTSILPLHKSPYDYLMKPQNGVLRFIQNIKNEGNFKNIYFLIIETIFPPKVEIENKYGKHKNHVMYYFYIKRIVLGVIKWIRPQN